MPSIAGMMGGGGMGTSVGAAFVTIGANVAPFVGGMGKATVAANAFKKSAMGILAVGAAIKVVTSAFVEFDRQLKNTSTLVDYSTKKMDGIGNSVRAMARQYQVGSAEAQEALYHIYSATIYGASAMDVLTESAKGAAAGLASLGAVGDMLTTVINAYGMAASRAAEINDYLFTTIKYGKVTMAELAGNFGRLAGVAAPVGASISEMSAAIATLTRQGIRTDWAITSLRQTLMQFIKPVKNLDEAITAMGYSSGTAIIRQEGFAGALKLVTKWAKENNVEMSEMFTNVRAITAVLPLTTTAAAGYAMDLARMANSTGAATEAFVKQTKSMSFQLEKLGSLVKDTAISIGKVLVPTMQILMTVIAALANVLREVFEAISKLGGDWVIAAAASIGILIASVKGLTLALAKLGLTAASVSTGAWISGITTSLGKMFRMIGANSILFGRFLKDVSYLGVGRNSLGQFTKSMPAMFSGLATAALGIGAAAFSVKQIMNIEVEPIIKMGEVQGVATAIKALRDSIGNVISSVAGGAVSGAMIGSMLGQPVAGAVIGGAVGAIGVAIKIIHEVRVVQAELDAPRIEELKSKFLAEFDFPDTIPGFGIISDFLADFSNVPVGTVEAIRESLESVYDVSAWGALFGETATLTGSASVVKSVLGDLSLSLGAGAEDIVSFAEDAWKAAKLLEASGGVIPTEGELLSMDEAEMANWGASIRNIMNDTVDPEVLGLWMTTVMQASIDNSISRLNSREGIDIGGMTDAITSALEMPILDNSDIKKRRNAIASAVDVLLSEDILPDEIFAYIESNFKSLGDGAILSVLEGLGKSMEDYDNWKIKTITENAIPQITLEGLADFGNILAGIDPIMSKINKEFFDLWDTMDETPIGEKAAVWEDLGGVLVKWRKEVEVMAAKEDITADKAKDLNRALDLLEGVMGGVESASNRAAAAIQAFNDSMSAVSLSNLLEGVGGSLEDLQQAFISEQNPVAAMHLFGAIKSYVESIPIDMQSLETGFLESQGLMQETIDKAYQMYGELGELPYKMGTTFENIAAEELKRLDKEKADADEISAKQKEAADKQKQAAEDAAAAAQEAFRGIFKEPMLEGVRRGDWKSASDAIIGFARSSREIMDFAGNLSSANGEIIDEIEVLGLITGSFGDLKSTLDNMITLGNIAGEDTISLESFRQSIEDLADPLAGLAKKIREILGIQVPSAAGGEIRALMEALYGIGGKGFQSGGPVPGVGSGDIIPAMLEPGEFVVPKWMMDIPAIKYLLAKTYKRKLKSGGFTDPSEGFGSGFDISMPGFTSGTNNFLPPLISAITTSGNSTVSAIMATSPLNYDYPDGGGLSSACSGGTCPVPDSSAGIADAVAEIISTVQSEFAAAVAESTDSAAGVADDNSATEAAVGAVDSFVEAFNGAVPSVGELMDTINDLQEKINSGTMSLADENVARNRLLDITTAVIGASDELESRMNNQISAYEMLGWETEAVELELKEFQAAIKGVSVDMMVWAERWADTTKEITDLIISQLTDALHTLLKKLFGLGEEAESLGQSLNIPSGYKVDRAAWAAATPGEPGEETSGATAGNFWDSLLLIAANALVKWTITDIVEKLVGWFIDDIVKPIVEWFIDDIVRPILNWFITDIVKPIWDWLITDIVMPVVNWFITDIVTPIWNWTIDNIVKPLIAGVNWFITDIVKPIWNWTIDNIVKPLIAGVNWFITDIVVPIKNWVIQNIVEPLVAGVSWFITDIVTPVTEFMWNKVLKGPTKWVWENVIKSPDWTSILGTVSKVAIVASSIIIGVTGGRDFGSWLADILGVNEQMRGFLEDISGVFGGALMGALMGFLLGGNIGAWIGLAAGSIAGAVAALDEGGRMLDDGLIYAHKGEVIVPAGEVVAPAASYASYGVGGQVIDNTIVLDGNVLYRGMKKVNRQEQLRRTGSSIGGRAWQGA